MYKTFIAGITAVSLTLSTAAPAQASGFNEEDIGKILFGLIATAAVANLIQNNQSHAAPAPAPAPVPRSADVHTPRVPRTITPHFTPRQPQRSENHAVKVLPSQCLRNIDTRYGDYRMFQRNCMQEHYRFTADLPVACTVRVATNNGSRNGWDPQCLRKRGYTSTRR